MEEKEQVAVFSSWKLGQQILSFSIFSSYVAFISGHEGNTKQGLSHVCVGVEFLKYQILIVIKILNFFILCDVNQIG